MSWKRKLEKSWGRLGMRSEWENKKIGDIVDVRRGSSPRPIHKYLATNGVPWVKIADATSDNSRYIWRTSEYITNDGVEKSVKIEPETLIVSNSATPGLPKIIKITACVHDGWLVFSNYRGVLRDFLYYKFIDIRRVLINQANGSVFQNLKTDIIRNFDISLPNTNIQIKIVNILSNIDDKIELNTRINNNLEQQAKVLYKDWFFNFSPFSTDGTLPDGWRVGNVNDIIQLHDSKRVPLSGAERDKMAKIYPYYGATSLMDYVDNYLFDGIYLLLGEDGTVVDSLGFPILQYVYGQFWVNNHAHIITGKEGFSVEELYLFFSLTNIKSIVTGAVQQKVSQQNLRKVPAIIPNKEVLSAFDKLIQPIFAQIRNIRDENASLVKIRDTLLVKLMSGDIDVSDIDL